MERDPLNYLQKRYVKSSLGAEKEPLPVAEDVFIILDPICAEHKLVGDWQSIHCESRLARLVDDSVSCTIVRYRSVDFRQISVVYFAALAALDGEGCLWVLREGTANSTTESRA